MNERNLCVDEYNDCQSQLTWCDSAIHYYSMAGVVNDSIIGKSIEVIKICSEDNYQLVKDNEVLSKKNRIKNAALSFCAVVIIAFAVFSF